MFSLRAFHLGQSHRLRERHIERRAFLNIEIMAPRYEHQRHRAPRRQANQTSNRQAFRCA